MASINEKLNYINETKSLIKDKLNDLGSEIDNETTFREYVEKIEDLYNEWPKVNDEDTAITLNNTKKGKMNLQLKGNVSQFTTTGTNILPQNNYITTRTVNGITYTNNEDGTFDLIGTATANTSINIIPNNILNEGTYYLYSSVPYNSATFNMSIPYKQDGVQGYLIANSTKTLSGTITDTKLAFYIENGQSINQKNIKLMLINGNTAPDQYEPYTGGIASPNQNYPQDIQIVTGNNNIIIYNKNIAITNVINYNAYNFLINQYNLKQGEKYTISFIPTEKSIGFNLRMNNSTNTTFVQYKTATVNERYSTTFTCPEDGKIFVNNYSNGFKVKDLMIEHNSYLTNFEKHASVTYPINLGSLELCKINNSQDYLYKNNNNWYKKPIILKINSYNGETISTDYKSTTGSLTTGATVYYVNPNSNPDGIQITDATLITQLNALEQAMSYNDQTNTSQENDNLPFIINATALMKNSD